jgi:hypothetical protein
MPILDTHSWLAAGSGITGNAGGGGADRRWYPARVLIAVLDVFHLSDSDGLLVLLYPARKQLGRWRSLKEVLEESMVARLTRQKRL